MQQEAHEGSLPPAASASGTPFIEMPKRARKRGSCTHYQALGKTCQRQKGREIRKRGCGDLGILQKMTLGGTLRDLLVVDAQLRL